ncbi:hypothetical protein HPB52_014810 [Rhipicephalus sanguineus]|uniref:Uncharacterized protein n=1 Tax=Rhipicephalus sanguineus TaxID=34632 RepID=A0A9D4PKN3_RHISA|nr:hypothetical protein HPB52_014810 [Rhipicephalus sanguineus]
MAVRRKNMAAADQAVGEAVTSRQRFREATTPLKFRQAKMATSSLSRRALAVGHRPPTQQTSPLEQVNAVASGSWLQRLKTKGNEQALPEAVSTTHLSPT